MSLDPQLLKKYAQLTSTIKEAEKELTEIKDHIVGAMMTEDLRQIKIDEGMFTLAERAQWQYTPVVKELEQKVKDQKKAEEETGSAKASTLRYLTFKA